MNRIKAFNHPGFHRRQTMSRVESAMISASARCRHQSHQASLGLAKIAAHLALNPLPADIEALALARLEDDSKGGFPASLVQPLKTKRLGSLADLYGSPVNHDHMDADRSRVSTSPCTESTGSPTEAQLADLRAWQVEVRIQMLHEKIAQAHAHQLLRETSVAHLGSSYSAGKTGCHAVDPVLPESVQPTVAPHYHQR